MLESNAILEDNNEDLPQITDQKVLSLYQSEDSFLILFVNPISGSQEGKIILELVNNNKLVDIQGFSILHFPHSSSSRKDSGHRPESIGSIKSTSFDKNKEFCVITFSIIDKEDYAKGKKFLLNYLNKYPDSNNVKVLIGGGDGTVLRLVEELSNYGIPLTRCIFSHIPLGTGNDLSNAMGFGNTVDLSMKISRLHRVLYTYLVAEKCKIDVWEITLILNDTGFMNEVKSSGEHTIYDETGKGLLRKFSKTFINYMSIGFDAKVGFNFEQKRSSSRICNKMIYCWEATKRYLCCMKIIPLTQILESFQVIEDKEIISEEDQLFNSINSKEEMKEKDEIIPEKEEKMEEAKDEKKEELLSRRVTIFRTEEDEKIKKGYQKVVLKNQPIDIICQNINFYMGGSRNIWENSGTHLGIKMMNAKKEDMKKYKEKVLSQFNDQKYDDKKIEFFSYDSGISMALEKMSSGQARKLYQGEGPVVITFKEKPTKKEVSALNKVYLNVDGEFFHLLQPKELTVQLNTKICNGQINFLRNIKVN